MVVLFPPSVLALVSNNAVPGDPTYPIKRALENLVVSITSVNPSTRAWFSATRSYRRFEEARVLITRGKEAGNTLDELIQQTETAAGQISEVSDEAQKQKLSLQLTESIQKYDKGLEQLSSASVITPQSSSVPVPQASSPTVSTPSPSGSVSANPSPLSSVKPSALPSSQPSLLPSPSSSPSVQPSPAASAGPSLKNEQEKKRKQKEIEEARKKLEEIRKRLEEEAKKQQLKQQQKEERKEEKSEEKKEDKKEEKRENKNRDR